MPPAISQLPRLRMLSFKSCALRSVLVPLPVTLQWLILTDNRLAELPQQMGELVLMRKLMLSNNRTLTRTARRMRMCTACARCCVRVLCVGTVQACTYAGLGALPRSTALRCATPLP